MDGVQHKVALEQQAKSFRDLSKIKDSKEFQLYFEEQLKVLSQKLVWAFTTGKDGDNVKNWEDFCRVRGEVVARLQPIQDVYAAKGIADHITQQLKDYYLDQS